MILILRSFLLIFFGVIVLSIPMSAYAEDLGSISIEISYVNGDRASHYGISLLIYQDSDKHPFKEIKSIPSNPFDIVDMPIGHRYKIEVYSDDMHASVVYVDLKTIHQNLKINIPLSGGMRINAFYNDAQTPIDGAKIYILSQNNHTITSGVTDTHGQTMRFWLSPTVEKNDYYKIDVEVAPNLVYSLWPVFLTPGDRQEKKIVTDWPPLIDNLITVKVYDNQSNLVNSANGGFMVAAYNSAGDKVSTSPVNLRGEAYFYNLKVGEYTFKAINKTDGLRWGNSTVIMTGQKTEFDIRQDIPMMDKKDPLPAKPVNQVVMHKDNSSKIEIPDPASHVVLKPDPNPALSNNTSSINDKNLINLPDWMKNDAKWWASGMITDSEFIHAIKFIINMGNEA